MKLDERHVEILEMHTSFDTIDKFNSMGRNGPWVRKRVDSMPELCIKLDGNLARELQ